MPVPAWHVTKHLFTFSVVLKCTWFHQSGSPLLWVIGLNSDHRVKSTDQKTCKQWNIKLCPHIIYILPHFLHFLFGPRQITIKTTSNLNYLHAFSNLHLPKVALLLRSPDSGDLLDVKYYIVLWEVQRHTDVVKEEHLSIQMFFNLVWHSLTNGRHRSSLTPLYLGTCNHLFSSKLTISTSH